MKRNSMNIVRKNAPAAPSRESGVVRPLRPGALDRVESKPEVSAPNLQRGMAATSARSLLAIAVNQHLDTRSVRRALVSLQSVAFAVAVPLRSSSLDAPFICG